MTSNLIRAIALIAIAASIGLAAFLFGGTAQVSTEMPVPAVSPSVTPVEGSTKDSDESLVKGWTNAELSAYMGGKMKHLTSEKKAGSAEHRR